MAHGDRQKLLRDPVEVLGFELELRQRIDRVSPVPLDERYFPEDAEKSEFFKAIQKVLDGSYVGEAVFKIGGEFHAYLNHCPHMGGPACQGKMIAKVEEVIADDRTSKGMTFSKEKLHVVCPWHGFEFNLETGCHPGDANVRLTPVKVDVRGGQIYVGVAA